MSSVYQELLQTTIQHLESLKASGVRFVPVAKETLSALEKPAAGPTKPVSPRTTPKAPPPERKPLTPTPPTPTSMRAERRPMKESKPQEESLALALPGQVPKALPALSPEAKAAAFTDLRQ